MYNRFKNLKKKEKGQGLVEYALILVLVAIVVIAALLILGPQISVIFDKVNIQVNTALHKTPAECTSAGYQWRTAGQSITSYGGKTITFTNDVCVHPIN